MRKNVNYKIKWTIVSLAIFVLTVVIGLFVARDFYVNGSEYRSMVEKCGTGELVVGQWVPKDPIPRYTRPSDNNYVIPAANAHYFCNEQEALDAGYKPFYD